MCSFASDIILIIGLFNAVLILTKNTQNNKTQTNKTLLRVVGQPAGTVQNVKSDNKNGLSITPLINL